MTLETDSGTRTLYAHRLDKEFSSTFPVDYTDQQLPEEGRGTQWLNVLIATKKMREITRM